MRKWIEKLNWFPPLLSRLVLAGVFIQTGWGKINYIENVTTFFMQLNIPYPVFNAHLVAYTELSCGIAMLIGLFTRFAAIPLSVIMLTALCTAHTQEIQNLYSLLVLSPFLYLILCIGLMITGAGKVSMDYLIKMKSKSSHVSH